jgi:iron(II)-dependent oxidoreductase
MAGNVWEWTRSLWGSWTGSEAVLEFGYPYDANDGREDLEAGDDILRVLRGGSFSGNRLSARCAFRGRYSPYDDWSRSGFRVVVSPISPSSVL